ncbi:hypothetical protein GS429_17455 [Natronorubrum sp. JWXQ-INN-674]|uniref:Uncharacterized protein n=1 Tax=Natronorubrum halalkaliphilum TaxID=2691917 RepID=A0A6B0VS59_9EURY|nr:metalloprotease family protein [Natronorubrum halalkaliphilum]MXV63816.1 hypothetical protein [Natronorubrum halalkaliphilum]
MQPLLTVLSWYQKLLLLGTVVHELAHALTVKLCGGQINEIKLTSHVNHHGRYNLGHQIAISYAPLVINTALAAITAAWAVGLPDSSFPQEASAAVGGIIPVTVMTVVLQVIALGFGFIVAAAALPSYTDARNPYRTFRQQLAQLTVLRVLTIPLALLILLIGTIPLTFAYLRSRSSLLHIISEMTFATAVLLQATGTAVIVDPTVMGRVLVDYFGQF